MRYCSISSFSMNYYSLPEFIFDNESLYYSPIRGCRVGVAVNHQGPRVSSGLQLLQCQLSAAVKTFSLRLTVSTEKLAGAIERSRSCERRHAGGATGEMATTTPGRRAEAAGSATERKWPSDIVRVEPGECARPGPSTAGAEKGARRGLAAGRGRGFRQPARPPGRIWPSL